MFRALCIALLMVPALAAGAAPTRVEHVGVNAERGDPARWDEPSETPRDRYQAAMKEASAALAEAKKECRSASDPARCQADARNQYRQDVEYAKSLLSARPQEKKP